MSGLSSHKLGRLSPEVDWSHNANGQQNHAESNHVQRTYDSEYRAVSKPAVEQSPNHQSEDNAAHGAAKSNKPGE
jgi:hypothetical protein